MTSLNGHCVQMTTVQYILDAFQVILQTCFPCTAGKHYFNVFSILYIDLYVLFIAYCIFLRKSSMFNVQLLMLINIVIVFRILISIVTIFPDFK